MIAEYYSKHRQTGGDRVRYRTPVDSPMDLELKRQLDYMDKHNRRKTLFRRVVGTAKGPLQGTGNPTKIISDTLHKGDKS